MIVLLPAMSTINEMVLITDLDSNKVKGKYPNGSLMGNVIL